MLRIQLQQTLERLNGLVKISHADQYAAEVVEGIDVCGVQLM